MMTDLLSAEKISQRGLFNTNTVMRLVSRHCKGTHDHAGELWGLMSIEMWMQKFVDQTRTEATKVCAE